MEANESSEVINMADIADIDRLNNVKSKLYLIEPQYKSQDRIYWRVVYLGTLFEMIEILVKLEFKSESYNYSKLGSSSKKNEWNFYNNINFKSIFGVDVNRTGKFSIEKSCRVLNSPSTGTWIIQIGIREKEILSIHWVAGLEKSLIDDNILPR